MNEQNRAGGLLVFVISVYLNLSGLTIDLLLLKHGYATISELARKSWLPWMVIVGVNVAGLIGILCHLQYRKGD